MASKYNGDSIVHDKIDWEQARKYYGLNCTHEEVAMLLGISEDTLSKDKKLRNKYRDLGQSQIKTSLKRKLYSKAMEENDTTCLIFALKNYCGFSDKAEIQQTNKNIEINIKKASEVQNDD